MTVNNRTTVDQDYRIIIWDTSDPSAPKTSLRQFAEIIPANNTDTKEFIISPYAGVTRYEIEFRMSSPHMVPWIFQIFGTPFFDWTPTVAPEIQGALAMIDGSIWVKETVYTDELFTDSTPDENP